MAWIPFRALSGTILSYKNDNSIVTLMSCSRNSMYPPEISPILGSLLSPLCNPLEEFRLQLTCICSFSTSFVVGHEDSKHQTQAVLEAPGFEGAGGPFQGDIGLRV